MAKYKLLGPADSEKDGWFRSNAENHEGRLDLGRIEMDVGPFVLMAEVESDEDYPGIYLSILRKDEDGVEKEQLAALLEFDDENEKSNLFLRVWGDPDSPDETETIPLGK